MRADLLKPKPNENAEIVHDFVAEVKSFKSAQKANKLNKSKGTHTLGEPQSNEAGKRPWHLFLTWGLA